LNTTALDYIRSNGRTIHERRIGKLLWPNTGTETEENHENPQSVLKTEIRTGNLWNTSLERYHYTSLFGAHWSLTKSVLVMAINNDLFMFISQVVNQIYKPAASKLPTAAARVRSQVRSCGICGGQSATGAGFLQVLRFPLPILSTNCSIIIIIIIRGSYNRPTVADVPSGLSLTPPRETKK
jgi:hypothetical protein